MEAFRHHPTLLFVSVLSLLSAAAHATISFEPQHHLKPSSGLSSLHKEHQHLKHHQLSHKKRKPNDFLKPKKKKEPKNKFSGSEVEDDSSDQKKTNLNVPIFGLGSIVAEEDEKSIQKVLAAATEEPDYETDYGGGWEIANVNAGVSSMQLQLMPLGNKIIMFDATYYGASGIKLPEGRECRIDTKSKVEDCWAHSIEFDGVTGQVRPLKVLTDTWCSSGALSPNGTLVNAGGWNDGSKAVRYVSSCDTCDWTEYMVSLTVQRWYATQQLLPDGRFIVIGGRRQFSYEFIPNPGEVNTVSYTFPFLEETTDKVENNLYPFVHLSVDGNLFIFANNRSIILDPVKNTVLRELPVLAGGPRNYPGSGMSAILPINLKGGPGGLQAEVLVCGGAPNEATPQATVGKFVTGTSSCGRIDITQPDANWFMEEMPMPRLMGDMLLLPNAEVLMINGASKGAAGWGFASEPVLEPVLYKPKMPHGSRFKTLTPTTIPRMYHSTSAVIPDGRVVVAGSNTNALYNYTSLYPTELRVERFLPPYLDPKLKDRRPVIEKESFSAKMKFGEWFSLRVVSVEAEPTASNMILSLYSPPFTTHGFSMNQRMLLLKGGEVINVGPSKYEMKAMAPESNVIAPPGYYLLFAVHRGIPSEGIWVQVA